MAKKEFFKGGLSLNFYSSASFESLQGLDPKDHPPIMARNLWRFLMMSWNPDWKELVSWDSFSAAFISHDPLLLKEWRYAYQQGLLNVFKQLQGKQFSPKEQEQIQLYLSNCLSLFPYTDPNRYEFLKVPQYVNGQWILVDYKIEPIELTETSGFYKLFLQDRDRVFAYGLTPLENLDAQSHLIFAGTTYPAGQGFVPQVTTDLKGFETVGKSLYLSGRERLLAWLNTQKTKPHVCGVSLGGSLSLLIAREFGHLLSRVDALNPAGLHDSWFLGSPHDKWDELTKKPVVVVQQQANDPVSLFGVWKEDWVILSVNPPKEIQGPYDVFDHIINYAGNPKTEFHKTDPKKLNEEHRGLNIGLYSIARGIFYYTVLVPFNYLIRPVFNVLWNNKILTAAAILGVAISLTLPLFGLISSFVAGISALSWVGVLAVGKAISYTVSELTKTHDIAAIHDPALPRNASMDLYDANLNQTFFLNFQQIHSYYQVMRCLVKNKPFVQEEMDTEKKRLLMDSAKPEHADYLKVMQVSKAKAYHIHSTLRFVNEIGMQNKEQLKAAVEQSYAEYKLGKPAKMSV